MRAALIAVLLAASAAQGQAAAGPELKPFKEEIPKAAYAIEMVPVPGDAAKGIKPFWISKTEVTWEAFDVYVYKLDEGGEQGIKPGDTPPSGDGRGQQDPSAPVSPPSSPVPQGGGVDAVTRPTKPYLPPDRGFGHEGYAAICLSHASATEFCKWLSMRSGKKFRLATEDEWELACGSAPAKEAIGESAWGADNAEAKPHRVATKTPNALGVYDMLGNVAEWVDGRDGHPVTKGGSYKTALEELSPALRQKQDRSWNSSDPQVPKSKWWLADGPFVGFRIVCEPGTDAGGKPEDGKKERGR